MKHDRSFLPFFRQLQRCLALSVACLFFSCHPQGERAQRDITNNTPKPPVLFASVPPQAFLLKFIAGPEFEVRTLIDADQDPHHWLPAPKQILALSKAAAWWPAELPFEHNLLPKIRATQNPPQIFPSPGTHPPQAHHDHSGSDPHNWLSPPLLIEQTHQIAEVLSQLDPDNTSLYQQRARDLGRGIAALHKKLTRQLAPHKGRSFLIFHNALEHFAHTYSLSQKTIQSGDASPDPKRLREIIKQAQQDKTRVVFVQPQFDGQSAHMIARAIGGEVVTIDPLAEDVLANLQHIADTLLDAFSQADH